MSEELQFNSMSQDLKLLYLNDPLFHSAVRGGLDTEEIILAMGKRNKELADENIKLQINSSRPIIINGPLESGLKCLICGTKKGLLTTIGSGAICPGCKKSVERL